jgi:hypothetical protein
MNPRTLKAAITEAERFLRLAHELQEQAEHTDWIYVQGTAASGATRRASMDLTRALADLRRST